MSAHRLFAAVPDRMCRRMRTITASILLAVSLLLAGAAAAQRRPAAPAPAAPAKTEGPKEIGHFDDWTAATNAEAGQTICYAFTYASHSTPALPGRDKVVLTVTERPTGRDAVAISAGYAYPANATVTVQVDQNALDFYIAGRSAFARDGHAAATAFARGKEVISRAPGPRTVTVVDTFSLRGFTQAYQAINKACPAR
jgi:glucose/arabinose dehydrogenase